MSDLTMTTDPERDGPDWLTDLADRSRFEAEPAWSPDLAAIAHGGARRRRMQLAAAGGGGLAVSAVVLAVALGLGAGSGGAAQPANPQPLPTIGSLDQYLRIDDPAYLTKTDDTKLPVPNTMVNRMWSVLSDLDPNHTHLRAPAHGPADAARPYVVFSDFDPGFAGPWYASTTSVYTVSGGVPSADAPAPATASGSLRIIIAPDAQSLGRDTSAPSSGTGPEKRPCGYSLTPDLADALGGSGGDSGGQTRWSDCPTTRLADGSTIESTSGTAGPGTLAVAVRSYPDGSRIALVWADFPLPATAKATIDPATVLPTNPYSADRLKTTLTTASYAEPPYQRTPSGIEPRQFLTAADLGPGGAAYADSPGPTDRLPSTAQCGQTLLNSRFGRSAAYQARTPDGQPRDVDELEFPQPPGTGATALSSRQTKPGQDCSAPAQAQAVALPPGIGDEGFITVPGAGDPVRIWLRFGDTLVEVVLNQDAAHPLDSTAPANHDWLVGIAQKAAQRWTGAQG